MEWQDIKTAPRDGTKILVWTGFDTIGARYNPPMGIEEYRECIGMPEDTEAMYEEWQAEERAYGNYDCWSLFPISDDEIVLEADMILWTHIPKPTHDRQKG